MAARNPEPHPPTLAIAGGYSSGHVMPGIAVAEWAQAHLGAVNIHFFGSSDGPERAWVERAGYAFTGLPVLPVRYLGTRERLRSAGGYLGSAGRALRQFRKLRVRALVCLGSYASVAPTLAAMATGRPIVVFEANAFPGMGNRLAAVRARRFFVTALWKSADRRRQMLARLPLRAALAEPARPRRPEPGRPLRFLVLGGSLGHGFLNTQAPGLFAALAGRGRALEVWHQCGLTDDPGPIRARYADAGVPARVERFMDPIREAYDRTDFALTAAGAVTLHELAARRVPSMVFPLGIAADDHQRSNARTYAAHTGAAVVDPAAFEPAAVVDQLDGLWDPAFAWSERWDGCSRFLQTARDDPWQQFLRGLWSDAS